MDLRWIKHAGDLTAKRLRQTVKVTLHPVMPGHAS